MNFEIKKLDSNDAKSYRELRRAALSDVPILFIESPDRLEQYSPEELRMQLEDNNSFLLGAFDREGRLVGMIGFRREVSPRLDHVGFIWGLYVAPVGRGSGLGRALIKQTLAEAKRIRGIEQVKLQLEAGNTRARQLYESFGFEVWGLEPKAVRVDGVYYDDFHMILKQLRSDQV